MQLGKWDRIKNPDIACYIYGPLILDKNAKTIQ